MDDIIYSLGWDVGGWMGKNNSFVLIKAVNNSIDKWFYLENNFQIKENNLFELEEVIYELTDDYYKKDMNLVVGIDAPLTFPKDFITFLKMKEYIKKPKLEIYNNLAYRDTDRYIYEKYNKKPLSASFDRLGNNATVAMSHLRYWSKEYDINQEIRFKKDKINVIETYPALVKPGKYKKAFSKIDKIIPDGIKHGTDTYDAALCALMAIQFGYRNRFKGLPTLVYPPKNNSIYEKEGWIYHFDLDQIKQ